MEWVRTGVGGGGGAGEEGGGDNGGGGESIKIQRCFMTDCRPSGFMNHVTLCEGRSGSRFSRDLSRGSAVSCLLSPPPSPPSPPLPRPTPLARWRPGGNNYRRTGKWGGGGRGYDDLSRPRTPQEAVLFCLLCFFF